MDAFTPAHSRRLTGPPVYIWEGIRAQVVNYVDGACSDSCFDLLGVGRTGF